ncbi:MAG: NINE protein [Bacteroidota bacterium]
MLVFCTSLFSCNWHNYQAHFPNKGYYLKASVKPAGTNLQRTEAISVNKAKPKPVLIKQATVSAKPKVTGNKAIPFQAAKSAQPNAQVTASVGKQVLANTHARHARMMEKMSALLIKARPAADNIPPDKVQDKSQARALHLAIPFLLGYFGIHRLYLGYTGNGVLRLIFGVFTAMAILAFLLDPMPGDLIEVLGFWALYGGWLLVWAIVDYIRIKMGRLKPKYGGKYLNDL